MAFNGIPGLMHTHLKVSFLPLLPLTPSLSFSLSLPHPHSLCFGQRAIGGRRCEIIGGKKKGISVHLLLGDASGC